MIFLCLHIPFPVWLSACQHASTSRAAQKAWRSGQRPSDPVKAKLHLCSHGISCALRASGTLPWREGQRHAEIKPLGRSWQEPEGMTECSPQTAPSGPPSLPHPISPPSFVQGPYLGIGERKGIPEKRTMEAF